MQNNSFNEFNNYTTNKHITNNNISIKKHLPVGNFLKVILSFVIILGLLSNMLAISRGSNNRFTFSFFLETLQNAPNLPWSLTSLPDLTITGSWGVFDFLRSFFNSLTTAWSVLLYVVSCVQNVILFMLHFLKSYFLF